MPDLTDNQNSQRIGKTKTRDRLTKDFLRAMHPDSTHTVHAEYSSDIQPPGLLRRAGPGARTARRLPCPTGWTARRSTPTRARPVTIRRAEGARPSAWRVRTRRGSTIPGGGDTRSLVPAEGMPGGAAT